jgi:hypothetical protein
MVLIAIIAPYMLASFAEWSFNPGDWYFSTRIIVALIYAACLFFTIKYLDRAKNAYFGMVNRKNPDQWQ